MNIDFWNHIDQYMNLVEYIYKNLNDENDIDIHDNNIFEMLHSLMDDIEKTLTYTYEGMYYIDKKCTIQCFEIMEYSVIFVKLYYTGKICCYDWIPFDKNRVLL